MMIATLAPMLDTKTDKSRDRPEDSVHHDRQGDKEADHANPDPPARQDEVPFHFRDRRIGDTDHHPQPARDDPSAQGAQHAAEAPNTHVIKAYQFFETRQLPLSLQP